MKQKDVESQFLQLVDKTVVDDEPKQTKKKEEH